MQIKETKQQRRCAERRWRKSGLTVHRQIFIHHREKVKKFFLQAKKNYVCNKIERSSACKALFHITDQLSGKKKDSTLPSSIPTVDLPDRFGDFFTIKIQRLRDEPDFSVFCGPSLKTFSLVTEQQMKNIILKAPQKSCMLDTVPTWLSWWFDPHYHCHHQWVPCIWYWPPTLQASYCASPSKKSLTQTEMCLRIIALFPNYTSFQRFLKKSSFNSFRTKLWPSERNRHT